SAKFNFSRRYGVGRNLGLRIIDAWLCRKNVAKPTHGRCAALKNICHPSERNHRPHEQRQISVKGNQRAERNLPTQHLISAMPQHNKKRYADQRLQRWHEHAPGAKHIYVSRDLTAVPYKKTST